MHGPQNIKFIRNKFVDLFLVYLVYTSYMYYSIVSIAKSVSLRGAAYVAKTVGVGGGEREGGMQAEFPP